MQITSSESFFDNVYEVVKKVPYGRVTTYGAIAAYLSSPQASRMVGWALNASHNIIDVPAHRVVNRNGFLTGKVHFGGPEVMKNLLESEGITVENDHVKDFKILFWNPLSEL